MAEQTCSCDVSYWKLSIVYTGLLVIDHQLIFHLYDTVAYIHLFFTGVVLVQEYTLAIEVYRQLGQLVPDKLQATVISATGRIHLLLGDVAAAKECFAAAITDPSEEQLQSQLNRQVFDNNRICVT